MNYYNENDRYAAEWLRNLIWDGLIPPGDVDDRDIRDVEARDLAGYEQCHFFAGIGGWPHALRLARWTGPVWTGSCPCQPYSTAGKRLADDDPRNLWPEFRRLIAECRPPAVFGEQVASKAGRLWLDGVQADLEALGYAVGAADLCAAGVSAPHIRQRLFWVGHAIESGLEGHAGDELNGCESGRQQADEIGSVGTSSLRMGDTCGEGSRWDSGAISGAQATCPEQWEFPWGQPDELIVTGADGKTRRIESELEPMVAGFPTRVGRIRAYGNAICPQVAAVFIESYKEIRHG